MKRAVAWLTWLVLGLSPVTGFAVSFDAKDFDQLVAESEQIFIGTTSGATSRRHPGGAIVTDVSFTAVQVIKGDAGNAETSLMLAGGTLGAETLALPGMPRFQFGLTYLVFVQGNGTTIFPVVGGDQGMFQVKSDTLTGESLVFDSRGMPIRSASVRQAMVVESAAPQDAKPALEPITLEVFLRGIRSRLGSQ